MTSLKALVTGGTGFIGSHLVELLLSRSVSVRCLVRKTSDLRWLKGLPVEYVEGDLFDAGALRRAVDGVDYVFHSAGLTKAKTKAEYLRANAEGTRNLLAAVADRSRSLKRFTYISTQAAVGPSEGAVPVTEETVPHPITTYGRSKLAGEEECRRQAAQVPLTIVRPPAVYGPRDKDIFEFFNTMQKGLQPMVGMRERYVSLIHVKDLVRGIIMAAFCKQARGEAYFITSKEFYGWRRVGDVSQKVLGRRAVRLRIPEFAVYGVAAFAEFFSLFSPKPALINFEKARDMVQDYWTCDGAKAKRDFGFEQGISIEDGIAETVSWYKAEGWLK